MSTNIVVSKPVNYRGERIKLALRVPPDTKARMEYLQAEWSIETQGDLVDVALRYLERVTRSGLQSLSND